MIFTSVAALLAPILWATAAPGIHATSVTPDEMAEARRWVAAKFEGVQEPTWTEAGLVVAANHGPVQKNARGAGPLRIGDTQLDRGFYCHAPSKIVVRLPGPGRTFSAVVGVDSNLQTRSERGSVVFSVKIGDQEAFRSEVLREGTAATPVAIDLDGATGFVLEVGDAGDGNCVGLDTAVRRHFGLVGLPLCRRVEPSVGILIDTVEIRQRQLIRWRNARG